MLILAILAETVRTQENQRNLKIFAPPFMKKEILLLKRRIKIKNA